ncbi:cation diffusion facilitator family transporter [Caloramator quimbayensis]|uniref:Cation diffusion facilitator family transporter n=1 Tax=Caloramator quimbayensis TaxID=1147123 RepID=A0A1T4X5N5_9CLOT|nr:cation diffusion facilitator family transporter [Caloramator quimbayensis]SKA84739.1 cation diffusion facilitator family transporter [Caloramator quimbayensis]
MLSNYIIKKFIPESKKDDRQRYGYLGGIVGILVNILLFAVKFIIGTILNSVAITADAFNNLSDTGSSIVTIIGFKIADKPADKDHPFGHGRGEYIAGLVVSFMVLFVGLQFVKDSIGRILHPVRLTFELTSFLVLILSIGVKFWLGSFYKNLNSHISSNTLNATSLDSFSDVIITSTVALSLLLSKYISLPIDGYMGLVVSLFILFAGYNLTKDTISPLLGEAPEPELVNSIIEELLSYKGVIGTHDLIIHSYGANKYMASIHAEIPSNIPVMEAHEIIDKAENEISKKLNILLVIHMDPVNVDNQMINEIKNEISNILKEFPDVLSMHDFRIIGDGDYRNLLFDIVVSQNVKKGDEEKLLNSIREKILQSHTNYNIKIHIDRNYNP